MVVFIQVVAALLLMEFMAVGLSWPWQKVARDNCIRLDGTRSTNRSILEKQAYNRLRRELLFVLALVFLSGTILYYASNKALEPSRPYAIWAGVCVALIAWRLQQSYRTYAKGVIARRHEHMQFDMGRCEVDVTSDNQNAQRLPRAARA